MGVDMLASYMQPVYTYRIVFVWARSWNLHFNKDKVSVKRYEMFAFLKPHVKMHKCNKSDCFQLSKKLMLLSLLWSTIIARCYVHKYVNLQAPRQTWRWSNDTSGIRGHDMTAFCSKKNRCQYACMIRFNVTQKIQKNQQTNEPTNEQTNKSTAIIPHKVNSDCHQPCTNHMLN